MSDPMQQVDKAAASVASAEVRGESWVKNHASYIVLGSAVAALLVVLAVLFRVF